MPSTKYDIQEIECTIVRAESQSAERGIWSDWILGEYKYAKKNGHFIQKPLRLSNMRFTDTSTIFTLKNWTPTTYAIITTTTFVPSAQEDIFSIAAKFRTQSMPKNISNGVKSTRTLLLNDKQISEEYQYILKRAKADKWVSSNLTKPTLLMHPKVSYIHYVID